MVNEEVVRKMPSLDCTDQVAFVSASLELKIEGAFRPRSARGASESVFDPSSLELRTEEAICPCGVRSADSVALISSRPKIKKEHFILAKQD